MQPASYNPCPQGHRETNQREENTQMSSEESNMSKRPCVELPDEDEPESGGSHSTRMRFRMSKQPCLRRCSGHLVLDRCSGRAASRPSQQHIYLVVDDWERGYSIYRVQELDFCSDSNSDMINSPPLVRIVAQHLYSSFAAHGTKIFAMLPAESSPGIPVFDTQTLGVTVCPSPEGRESLYKPVFVSVGERLFAMIFPYLEVLGPEPPLTDESWSWTSVQPRAPFATSLVSCYAVHPDGRTVFMSVRGWKPNPEESACIRGQRMSTFTFDTQRLEWTYLGEWTLPFTGRAHYDAELDAWVGLCYYEEGAGHVCCCEVPPPTGCKTMPAWKLGLDAFFDAQSELHARATLLYKGDISRFCLVECQRHKDYKLNPRLRVVKMTDFMLKYDKEGELCSGRHRAYASMSYQIAHDLGDAPLSPVAFWM